MRKNKKIKIKANKLINSQEFTASEQAVIETIFQRIGAAAYSGRSGIIKVRSAIFLLEKYLFQLRLLEAAPDKAFIEELVKYASVKEFN
jgi:hypothetical protein